MSRKTARIELNIFNKSGLRLNKKKVCRGALAVCKALNCRKTLIINLIFIRCKAIKYLKKKYHHKNITTDVIVFSYGYCSGKKKHCLEGDVFISPRQVKKQAKFYYNSYYQELMTVIAHGILHVLGYADDTPGSRAVMFRKQEKLLAVCKSFL